MQLYANKTENLEEMDKFLEKYNLPRLNQDEIEEQSQVLKLELWLKNFQQTKSPEPGGFPGEFYWMFREELTPLLLKLFQKIAEEGVLQNSFYEASITLIPKPDKEATKNNYQPIYQMNLD